MSMTNPWFESRRMSWLLALAVAVLVVPAAASADDITIKVAPNVINLSSDGEIVTVNTDLPYSDVEGGAVYIANADGTVTQPVSWWKADNRGEFVAKFTMESVRQLGLEAGSDFHLFVHVIMFDGTNHTGSAEVKVIDQRSR